MIKLQNTYEILPIITIFANALTLPKKYFKQLLWFGTPTILLGIAAIVFSGLNIYHNDLILLLFGVTFIFVLANAIIACHRVFLLERQDVESTPLIRFTFREVMYIGRWLGIGIIVSFVIAPLSLILSLIITSKTLFSMSLSFIFIAVINSPAYYLIARLSLALPATAINARESLLSFSWDLSKGNGWRLTILFGTIPLLTALLFSILPSFESVFYSLLLGAAWLVVGVVEIGLLSLSYDYLYRPKITSE